MMPPNDRPNDVEQIRLPLRTAAEPQQLSVLDLFAGAGGLSIGFAAAGYSVTGVDSEKASEQVFAANGIGELLRKDLHSELIAINVPVVIGGPPCRPWSAVNMQRRGDAHQDHALVERFFAHLREIRPQAFLMENVPPLSGDPVYRIQLADLKWSGYSTSAGIVQYSNFGAATTRKRLFTVGFRDSARSSGGEFFRRLNLRRRPASTVREAIWWLRDVPRGAVADHEWSDVRTIGKYSERYRSGRYGWKRLDWDSPAPSFGSVSKTYVLHPDSDPSVGQPRVLSVREVLSIMGFDQGYAFPPGIGISIRYRMAANAVSPIVASECAHVIRSMLEDDPAEETVDESVRLRVPAGL